MVALLVRGVKRISPTRSERFSREAANQSVDFRAHFAINAHCKQVECLFRVMIQLLTVSLFVGLLAISASAAEDRDTKVRSDRNEVQAGGLWIYNDLSRGFEEARKTGKPLLVVLRCVP